MRVRGKSRAPVLLSVLLAVLVTACSNTPPPPVVSTPASQPTTPTKTTSQIVVGVDDIVGGYNPHNLADSSTVTTALAQLLLPSVFRPGQAGEPVLDENLMRSAEVISEQPFKVAYEIQQNASWSDGAPIAVEDFVYLYEAMRDEPGTVLPAGYRLISGIQPGEGGKRVEVTFSKPYPGWQTLFSNLLPAHLLKDAPGGWKGALAGSFPVYGGPFSIKTLDSDRGEIILERNDRYWAKPAAIDRLVLRRTDQPGMVAALRSGNDQFGVARTDETGLKLLGELGQAVRLHTLAQPRTANVLLRPSGSLTDDRVRAGVAALLDRGKLIAEGAAGGPSATLRADAQVLPPSDAGYKPTLPAGELAAPDQQKAEQLFASAGYTKEAGTWRKDGKPLSLVVASPGEQEPYAGVAKELAGQLIAAGVEVRTINPKSRDLFSTLLALPIGTAGQPVPPDSAGNVGVDVAVVPQPVGGDPASVLASTFGCRPGPEQPESSTGAAEPPDSATTRVPANAAAFCDRSLQPAIDAALTGSTPLAEALSALEPELWRRHTVIPLFQLADTLAIGSGVSGVTPGPPLAGPFGSAVNWTRGSR
ncbi:ABC transporter family substrate-binding protein [Amycolatopsis nigrescens]|uniref:ABC transporter family substrate-binding protein n=1 Tax=Amycolatopsis nigrescens TaxID=381445 RepID=UPI00037DECFC|nr:ABC transporter family substrate-binding protein [Amycolatopsis nigrescens]